MKSKLLLAIRLSASAIAVALFSQHDALAQSLREQYQTKEQCIFQNAQFINKRKDAGYCIIDGKVLFVREESDRAPAFWGYLNQINTKNDTQSNPPQTHLEEYLIEGDSLVEYRCKATEVYGNTCVDKPSKTIWATRSARSIRPHTDATSSKPNQIRLSDSSENKFSASTATKCEFTETSGKSTVQPAKVYGAFGNIWIEWGDGGRTDFTKMQNGSFKDEGNNSWIVNEQRAHLHMTRADGATMYCY